MRIIELDTAPPTFEDIDTAIEVLIANEIAGEPDPYDFGDFYEAIVCDQASELQGVGHGLSPQEVKAVAWITACGWLNPIPTLRLRSISRTIPPGWTFEVPVFSNAT